MIDVVTKTEPVEPLLSLQDVKRNQRITGTHDDELLLALIAAASSYLDGPSGILGRCVLKRSMTARYSEKPGSATYLPCPPLISVDEVRYVDTNGDTQTISSSNYYVGGIGGKGTLLFREAFSFEVNREVPEPFEIDFTAGYSTAASIPDAIKHAARMLVAHLYEHPEASAYVEEGRIQSTPFGFEMLIAPFREAQTRIA